MAAHRRVSTAMQLLAAAGITAVILALAAPATATVHGHNGRIAYRQYLDADHTHGAIFTVTAEGRGTRLLTHPPSGTITTEPDWSPDGRWIVYQVEDGGAPHITVVKIRPDGTDRRGLSQTCVGQCLDDSNPAWSPTGARIAVAREMCSVGSNNLQAIYTIGAAGQNARRITHQKADCTGRHRFGDLFPQWAPSGKRLTFERADGTRGKRAIFTVRLDGTHLRRITPWRLDAAQPDYSPNGRWILFRSHEGSDTLGNIWLMHPNGRGRHAVTHTRAESGKWLSATFAPNGQRIAVAKTPGVGTAGNADVYVIRLDGTVVRNVTSAGPWQSAPDWGPTRRQRAHM